MTSLTPAVRMSSLIPASSTRPGDDPIFALNAEAQRRKAAGDAVINASIGALMQSDGTLAIMPSVFQAFRRVDPVRAAAYAPIAGDQAFLDAIVHDVFADGPLASRATAVATPGGTGAIHHAVVNFLEPGQALLTTSYFWGPYRTIAQHTGRDVATFPMFGSDDRFDVDAFERALHELLDRQPRALVVFNFPCHNPTGYSLDEGEWRAVAKVLQREGARAPVAFLLDLAYAHYGGPGSERWVDLIAPIVEDVPLLVAWTASKSFAQYGARVGGLIAVSGDDEERQRIHNALSFSCRGTWSNCNHLGLLAVTELLTEPDLARSAVAEREELRKLLGERVAMFNELATSSGLRFPRYEGGFFVAVFTPDADITAKTAQEEGVFVVPMDGAVRIALCSTPRADIPRLVDVLARSVRLAESR